jgi:hypothetical protein
MSETGIPQGDRNMGLALLFAGGLGDAHLLPTSLQDVATRAELVARIDGPFIEGASFEEVVAALARRIAELARATRDSMPDVPGALDRVNVALRLWSECLSAAKTIALETRSGRNTPTMRAEL